MQVANNPTPSVASLDRDGLTSPELLPEELLLDLRGRDESPRHLAQETNKTGSPFKGLTCDLFCPGPSTKAAV